MKTVILVVLSVLALQCFAADHIIIGNRAAVDSPLEFTITMRGVKNVFVLSYSPEEKRGTLRDIGLFLKEKKRGEESLPVWVRSPNIRQIGVFRMTWKDKDEALSKIFSFSGDEISRMMAVVLYWKGEEEEAYFYPLAEIFKQEAKCDPETPNP